MPTRAKYAKMTKYKEGGKVISDADRKRVSEILGKPKTKSKQYQKKKSLTSRPMGKTTWSDAYSDHTGKEYQKDKVRKDGTRLGGFAKGGAVKPKGYSGGGAVTGGTSSQTSGRRNRGTF